MFIDYPASRRRWSLGRKIGWLRKNGISAFWLGIVPAVVSLVPLVNIIFMALIFPLFTVHATLNFRALEQAEKEESGALAKKNHTYPA
jgi:CysZ protein